MWVLMLNDMRSPKAEILTAVAKAETKEALLSFLTHEEVKTYYDGPYSKSYRRCGILEWYNPPSNYAKGKNFMDIKTLDFWIQDAVLGIKTNWHTKVDPLPTV